MSALVFHCDACGARLTAPAEKAGRKAKCRQCGSAVTIPSDTTDEDDSPDDETRSLPRARPKPEPRETEEDDEPEEDEEERPRRRKKVRSDWGKVSLGLLILLVTTAAGLVFGLLSCLGGFAFQLSPGSATDVGRMMTNLMRWTVIEMIALHSAEIATLAGYALCCFVSPRDGGRRLAVAALVLGGVGLAVNVGGDVITLRMLRTSVEESEVTRKMIEQPGKVTPEELKREMDRQAEALQSLLKYTNISMFLSQLRMLLRAAQYMTFAFFLMGLARALGARGTADNCMNLIKLSAAVVLLQFLNQACLGFALKGFALGLIRFMSIFGMGVALLGLGQAVWFVVIVHEVRGLVNAQGRRGRVK